MYKRAIIILADGACADVMDEEVRAGHLPNIAKCFLDEGVSLPAVTSFPSTTGPAYLPFLTGCLPGTCNVPGIRWFDKAKFEAGYSFDRYRSYVGFESFCMANDMWPHIKTIFELVPNSYSIFNPISRGAKGARNVTRISRIWYWYYAHLTDHWKFTDEAAIKKLRATVDRRPEFLFAVFPGIDEYAHMSSPRHERVLEAYRFLDDSIGLLIDDLKNKGLWNETLLFLVSDHGLSETHTHFCVNTFLEKRGLPAFFYPKIFDKRGKLSANMVSGNGMTHLYFKNHDGWTRHTVCEELEKIAPNFLDDMLNENAVDIIAVRNASGGIDILSRRGEARVRMDGQTLHYDVIDADPFGYPKISPDLDSRECLRVTLASEYPDAPFQITHLMTAPRSGDVIISASPGYDLRLKYENPEHKSSHGSLHASHMRVPVMTNARFEKRPMRTVDVFPTIMKLLGYPIPSYIDGEPLVICP